MRRSGHARRTARLAVIGGLSSFGPLSLDLYLPALPRVATALHTSAGAAQLSVSCCLAGLAAGQFVFGTLGDRFGRRGRRVRQLARHPPGLAARAGFSEGARRRYWRETAAGPG